MVIFRNWILIVGVVIVAVLVFIVTVGMGVRIYEGSPQDVISCMVRAYNDMDFEYVSTNYQRFRTNNLIKNLSPELIYIVASSLYRVSNYHDLLDFTNYFISDKFLSNNVILLVGFSLSELGMFEDSQKIISYVSTNEYLKYYTDHIRYYSFRNSIFVGKARIIDFKVSFLKDNDVDKVVELLKISDDNFAVFVSTFLQLMKKNKKSDDIVRALVGRSYKNSSSLVSVSGNLISSGFVIDGVKLFLTTSLPSQIRDYYSALLYTETKEYDKAKPILERTLKDYETNKKIFDSYNISFDKLLILNLRVLGNNGKEFNNIASKYVKTGGVEFLSYVLRNYRLLSPKVYLNFITNYYSRVGLTTSTKGFLSAFISYNLHEGNMSEINEFVSFMLKRTKNTYWEKEFLLLSFLFSDNKPSIASDIITRFPFTYEYIAMLELLDTNTELKERVMLILSNNYMSILGRYKTNSNLDDLNALIGFRYIVDKFGLNWDSDVNVYEEVEKFKKKLLFQRVSVSNANFQTNEIETNMVTSLPNYIYSMYSKGIILDAHLEVRYIIPRPNIMLVEDFKNLGMVDYVVRSYERFGFQNNNIYFLRAFYTIAFLDELYPTPFEDRVDKFCFVYGIDKSLVYSIMRQESRFSPFVVSVANAIGLMQLILSTADATAKRFLKTKEPLKSLDVFVIENNLHLGISHLKELVDFFSRYPESMREVLVIASYNGGITAVRRWYDSLKTQDKIMFVEGIRFHETREYTKIVKENKFIYDNFVIKSTTTVRASISNN
ncbi:MAG: lytic transglycosylase domain-containing protein [Brevinematales bacterium]|nr:lytic transglycosylase domain-containing protein [Brevinematales bacterium]